MAKKLFFIFILALGFAAYLIFRPYFNEKIIPPSILDRLPDDEYIGRINLLDFARESQKITEKNEVEFKDFLSYEFLLSQSKSYGIDLQKTAYVFGNSKNEFGLIVYLSDSSKVTQGINKLKIVYPIKDSLIGNRKICVLKKEKLYFYYDKSYAFIYKGNNFKTKFSRIVDAKAGSQSAMWKNFLNESIYSKDFFVLSTTSNQIKELGFSKAIVSLHSDSSHFLVKSAIAKTSPLNIGLKEKGNSFEKSTETSSFLNLHLDISKFRENPDNEILQVINKYAKRISFPTQDFINAWEGDVSFMQGGQTSVTETYIETIMDEEFNPIEVRKTKSIPVPKYSVMLTLNDKKESFFQQLLLKGIMTRDGTNYRFLTSPPLVRQDLKNQTIFNSGQLIPKIIETSDNYGFYYANGKKYEFALKEIDENYIMGEFKILFSDFINYIKSL